MKSAVAFIIVAIAVATNAVAEPQGPPMRRLLDSAKAHFELQEYAEAEADLKEAYKLSPEPSILYGIAQAQRLRGDCAKAIVTYRNFLRTNPRPDQAKLAEDNIATCSAKPEPMPEPKQEPKPEPKLEPKPEPKPEPKIEPRAVGSSWTSNWAGHLLVLGGLGATIGGGYLALHAQRVIDDIDSARFYDDFVTRSKDASTAKTERVVGLATAGLGGALIVAGIVSYVIRSPGKETTTVSIGPHGEIVVGWGF